MADARLQRLRDEPGTSGGVSGGEERPGAAQQSGGPHMDMVFTRLCLKRRRICPCHPIKTITVLIGPVNIPPTFDNLVKPVTLLKGQIDPTGRRACGGLNF